MVQLGNAVNEQLRRLGIPAEALGAQLSHVSTGRLAALSERLDLGFGEIRVGDNKYFGEIQDGRWNIPQAMSNPDPRASQKLRGEYSSQLYYQSQASLHSSSDDPLAGLFNRHTRKGATMARGLNQDATLRQRFERLAALQVVPDQRSDGAVSVAAMTSPGSSSGSVPGAVPQTFWDLFMQMDQSVMQEATRIGNIMTAGADIYGWSPTESSSAVSAFSTDGTFYGGGDSFFSNGTNQSDQVGETGSDLGGNDELTLVIKRMMDKRNQMYDVFKNVLDKHNESARTAIGNLKS